MTAAPVPILYIDDEPALLEIGRLFLERNGIFSVNTEEDPRRGLERILSGKYDAVISDYQMPGMDGIALLKEIRGRDSQIPFIIFTGKGREDVVVEALNNGADFYLQKGGDPKSQYAELSNKLEHAIGRRKAEEELLRKNEELAVAEEELRSQLEDLITTQYELRESRDLFRTFVDHSYDAIIIHDIDGRVIDVNETMLAMYRVSRDEALRYTITDYTGPAYNREDITGRWREVLKGEDLLFPWVARRPKEDSTFDTEVFLTRVERAGTSYILAFIRDISERIRAEKERQVNERRMVALFELTQIADQPEHVITNFALEMAVEITESRVGYLAFVSPDEATMTMYSWSQAAMDVCETFKKPIVYQVEKTGLWGEAIRQRRGIITNDYQADNPLKKGYPEGHVPIQRHMNVPVMDDGRIVIVSGVGNKEEPYDDQDIRQLTLLMDGLWKIIRNKRKDIELRKKNEELAAAEEEMCAQLEEIVLMQGDLRESNEYLGKLISYANTPIIVWNRELRITLFNHASERLTGISEEEAIGSDISILFALEDRDEVMGFTREAAAGVRWDGLEISILTRRGESRIVWWSSANITGSDGETIVSTIAQGQDITEHKLAKKALVERNEELAAVEEEMRAQLEEIVRMQRDAVSGRELLSQIVNSLPDPTLVVDVDGVVISWNRAMEDLTGVYASEMIGRGDFEYAIPIYGYRRPILIDIVRGAAEEIEGYVNVRKNDDVIEAETIGAAPGGIHGVFWIRASPLYDAEGRCIGGIEAIRNITHLKEQERKLRESESLLRNAGKTIQLGGWTYNIGDRHLIGSSEFLAIFEREPGFSPTIDEAVNVVAPEYREKMVRAFDTCIREGIPFEEEIEILTPNGDRKWVYHTGEAVRDESGVIVRLQGAFQNISGKRQLEDELKRREKFFLKVMEIVPVGLWFADKEGKLIGTNPAGAAIWGAEPNVRVEEYGIFHARRLPSGEEIAPDDWALARTLREGVTITDELLEIDAFDGEKRIILNYTAPVILDDGSMAGAIVVNHDVTEEVHAKEALLESEQRFRRLAENAEDIIFRIDLDPKPHISYVNPIVTQITGYTPEDHYADPFINEKLILPEDQILLDSIASDAQFNKIVTYRIIRKDGTTIWIEQKSVPIYDEEGILIAIEGISRDITAEKMTREELDRSAAAIANANRKLNLLTGITRHDISNQLSVLNGYLTLSEELVRDGKLAGYLEHMEEAIHRIQRQIEFAGEYQDLGVVAPSWQRLAEILCVVEGTVMPIIDETDGVMVYADPLLPKVFSNLMENTERYAEGATLMRVSCEQDDGDLLIICEDDGLGIPDDLKEQIFEKGVGKNTGLGLFFIQEILEITGISITEEGVFGEGARFVIRVPAGEWR